jgi:hypothetical protein
MRYIEIPAHDKRFLEPFEIVPKGHIPYLAAVRKTKQFVLGIGNVDVDQVKMTVL